LKEFAVQKVGGQFVLKKISDYVMAPSPPPQAEEETEVDQQPAVQGPPNLNGQVISDENGDRLGVARRLAGVNLYVIADGRTGLEQQLKATIDDPGSRVFFHHTEDGRLSGLIYVPDPSSRPAPVSASRAEDI
jgi:hypothetical protein